MTHFEVTSRVSRTVVSEVFPVFMLTILAGCVTIKAPDKPIEINLNVNIKQEVILSLKQDAGELIRNNEDLFPK